MGFDYDLLFSNISECRCAMQSLDAELRNCREYIKAGKLIDDTINYTLSEEINKVKAITKMCITGFKEMTGDDIVPASLDEMERAVQVHKQKNDEQKKRKSLISESANIMNIYSDDDEAAEAIERLKKQYIHVISDNTIEYEELKRSLEVYKLIIEAVQTDDDKILKSISDKLKKSAVDYCVLYNIRDKSYRINDIEGTVTKTENVDRNENSSAEHDEKNISEETDEYGFRYIDLNAYGNFSEQNISFEPYSYAKLFAKKSFLDRSNIESFLYIFNRSIIIEEKKLLEFDRIKGTFSKKKRSGFSEEMKFLLSNGYIKKISSADQGNYYALTTKGMDMLRDKNAINSIFGKRSGESAFLYPIEAVKASDSNMMFTLISIFKMRELAVGLAVNYSEWRSSDIIVEHSASAVYEIGDHRILVSGCFPATKHDVDKIDYELEHDVFCANLDFEFCIYAGMNMDDACAAENFWREKYGVNGGKVYYLTMDDGRYHSEGDDGEGLTEEDFEPFEPARDAEDTADTDQAVDIGTNTAVATEEIEGADGDEATNPDEMPVLEMPEEIAESEPANQMPKNTDEIALLTENEAREAVYDMLINGKLHCALAYAHAAGEYDNKAVSMSKQLSYAVDDPAEKAMYQSFNLFNVFDENNHGDFYDCCYVSAAMRSFFYSADYADYDIENLFALIKNRDILERIKPLKEFVNLAYSFKKDNRQGMDAYSGYRLRDKAELSERIDKIEKKINDYYTNYVLYPGAESKPQKRYMETRDSIFGRKNALAMYMEYILDKDKNEFLDDIKKEMSERFIKNGMMVRASSIDDEKIEKLIDHEWLRAGGKVAIDHRTWNLTAGLRNKLRNRIRNVVASICDWVYYMSDLVKNEADNAEILYNKNKDNTVQLLKRSVEELMKIIDNDGSHTSDVRAGAVVLKYTAQEFLRRVNGSYNETEHKYLYSEFLCDSNVTLNENFIPDYSAKFYDISGYSIFDRISAHFISENRLPEEHVAEIFARTDDFGTAQLIREYFDEIEEPERFGGYNIDDNVISQAKSRIDLEFEDFKGNLELLASYGQMSGIDEKERILAVVSEWYQYTVDLTLNFGFLKRLMDECIKKINRDASERESAFRKQFEDIIANHPEYRDCGVAEEIRRTLIDKNFTVAEEYIRKLQNGETEIAVLDDVLSMNYLEEFYDEYDKYYSKISKTGTALSTILSGSHSKRNKDTKGSKAIIDNWIKSAGTSEVRIGTLLERLGFNVGKVTKNIKLNGKLENYKVEADDSPNKYETYPHTVSAFGSEARRKGFKVICCFGTTNSARLVEDLNGINENTVVLLDFALPTHERRKLAKNIKQKLYSKVCIVIDRVMISYLADHYEDSPAIMIRKLMAVAMPFSYYQPYVPESSGPMSPEMFFGRTHELEDIKNVNGANMVYGGRQLGKSALLKKAKNDVDYNKDGSRAILVDVQKMNYIDAAKKVSEALVDGDILDGECECDNWSELCRHIKRRLDPRRHSTDAIPFLLLMIDEADEFISSSKEIEYSPFRDLKELQSSCNGSFKFVIAGLRDLVKFHHEVGGNNTMLHMKPITIRPFTSSEAEELLEKPLMYFGMRFPKEKHYLVSLILATANYFPGLIQMYCRKLIESFREPDYAGYSDSNSPEYEIDVKLIRKVLSDDEFRKEVNLKLEMTLRLDDDDYYFILALIMAFLYKEEGYECGYSEERIMETASEYGIYKISSLDMDKLKALLTELEDLNVFRRDETGRYLFSRHNFYQMLNASYNIEDEMEKYMED